jgi:hypothetical protein
MLDLEKIKKDFVTTEGVRNCLQMGMIFLRDEKDIKKFTPEMLDEFIETIVDIWKPEGDTKAEKSKKETIAKLKKILPLLQENIKKYVIVETKVHKAAYENAKPLFGEWQKYINKKLREDMDLKLANPFLTVSIANNLDDGISFQNSQKETRRAVTEWGGKFEGSFAIFSPKVKTFHAGRMDVKVGSTVYDIKSGPNVLNLRDVDGINKKISLIPELKNKSFGKFIEVTNYKVGIIYGRWELRNSYMKKIKEGGLVIGPDTWEELTGDGWNAFKFFIWQIRYGVEELNKKWSVTDLQRAVKIFLKSFYGNEKLSGFIEKTKRNYSLADDDAEVGEDGQCNSCHGKFKKGRKRWEEEETGKQFCKKCVKQQVDPKLFVKAENDPEFKIMKKIISKS